MMIVIYFVVHDKTTTSNEFTEHLSYVKDSPVYSFTKSVVERNGFKRSDEEIITLINNRRIINNYS